MICRSCRDNKAIENFGFKEGVENKRDQTCKSCRRFIVIITKLRKEFKEVKEQSENLKELWIECIESCEVRNSRRLRLTVDKAKKEIGGHWRRKVVL